MVRLERDRRLDAGDPIGVALARRAVDEVDADLLEAGGAGPAHRLGDASGRVPPVERRQHVRDRALHAERDAVDAAAAQLLQGLPG